MSGLRCSNCGFNNLIAQSRCARCGKPFPVIDNEPQPGSLFDSEQDGAGPDSLPVAGPASATDAPANITRIEIKPGANTNRSEFNPDISDKENHFQQLMTELETEVERRRNRMQEIEKDRPDSEPPRPVAADVGFAKMIRAGMVDLLIYCGIAFVFGLAGKWATAISLSGAAPSEIAGLVSPVAIVVLLVVWSYQVFFLSVLGQTPGGMTAGIEVLDKSDQRLSMSQAGVRSLVYLLCLLPAGLGFIPALLGASLPDKVAGTRLVNR